MINQDINAIYDRLEKFIENGIKEVINEKHPVYDEYKIIVSSEQQFIKEKEKDKLAIYIVVQYGQATVHYGQIVMPFSLVVLSEKNRLKIAQQLLYDYSIKNNMTYNDEKTIYQIIETPTRTSNFQLMFEGYRSILNASGSFIISENANFYGLIYHSDVIEDLTNSQWELNEDMKFEIDGKQINGEKTWYVNVVLHPYVNDGSSASVPYSSIIITAAGQIGFSLGDGNAVLVYENGTWYQEKYKKIQIIGGLDKDDKALIEWLNNNGVLLNSEEVKKVDEEVDFISSAMKCNFAPDTQAFYHRNNFTDSINKFGNLSFSFVIFAVSDSVLVNDILYVMTKKSDVNKDFKFTVQFLKKHSLTDNFKLIDVSADQQVGDMTMLVLTFID